LSDTHQKSPGRCGNVNYSFLKDQRRWLIIGLVSTFALIVLWLHLIPRFVRSTCDILSKVASDQIEGTSTTYKVPESAVMQGMTVGPAQRSGTMPRELE